MRRYLILIGIIACLSPFAVQSVRSQLQPARQTSSADRPGQEGGKTQPAADRSADEAAIRTNVAAFVGAYNAGDAKAVAALFTPDGQLEDKDGDQTEGREAIAQTFANIFAEAPKKRI